MNEIAATSRAPIHAVRIVASVQFAVAMLCAVVFAVPSLYLFSHPITLLLGLVAWSFGLYLLFQYHRLASGRLQARASLGVWIASLAFNLGGYALLFGLGRAQPSSVDGPLAWLLLPTVIAAVCGVIGVAIARSDRGPL